MSSLTGRKAELAGRVAEMLQTLRGWPWIDTLQTLRERFREDRLSLTASSLTFTTLISLVPLVTVALAVFTAFPMFSSFQVGLENYFLQALVPDAIARPVLRALTQFAGKARGLGSVGLLLLLLTAIALMLTIDRALNAIWRVRKPRPIGQRVLVWWAALTLGPLVIGMGLTLTVAVLGAGPGAPRTLPGGVALLIDLVEFALVATAMAGLFHYVPNTFVRWRHAWAGGLFVALGLEAAKRGLAWYLELVPSFSAVYGAFASVPILLLWVYLVWVVVLLGAVIAAYAPSLQMGLQRASAHPGATFEVALAVLRELRAAQRGERSHGVRLHELAETLRLDPLLLDGVLESLAALDWVGRLDEDGVQRHVLLVDPAHAPAALLVRALLLRPTPGTEPFRHAAGIDRMTLAQLL